jgi:hypothetical protein
MRLVGLMALRAAIVLLAILLHVVSAGTEENATKPAEDAGKLWSADFGLNVVSAYFAFGIMQENQGVIAEPYLDVTRVLFEGTGLIDKITLGLQLWSSIHSEKTGAERVSAFPRWYEFDYYIPVGITVAKRLTMTISYLEYEFPNGAFTSQRGVQANIGFDDTDLPKQLALHPHFLVLYNFEGVFGVGKTNAWYGELGIAPTATLRTKSRYPITLAFPLTLGVGDDHFYPGDAYGYFSATANLTVPLAFLPKSVGAWTANLAITYYDLGGATAGINANHDHNAFVGQVGVGLNF